MCVCVCVCVCVFVDLYSSAIRSYSNILVVYFRIINELITITVILSMNIIVCIIRRYINIELLNLNLILLSKSELNLLCLISNYLQSK